ncbi:MAG: hypothetical protein D6771_02905, partial [Zetaproteobacteria bacterium]
VWDARFGVEWRYDARWQARAGLSWQKTPVNGTDFSPRLPGADRYGFSVGLTRTFGDGKLDFAYMFLWTGARAITNDRIAAYNGTYKTRIHIVALDWRWAF